RAQGLLCGLHHARRDLPEPDVHVARRVRAEDAEPGATGAPSCHWTVSVYEPHPMPPRSSCSTTHTCTVPAAGATQTLSLVVVVSLPSLPLRSRLKLPPVANQETCIPSRAS